MRDLKLRVGACLLLGAPVVHLADERAGLVEEVDDLAGDAWLDALGRDGLSGSGHVILPWIYGIILRFPSALHCSAINGVAQQVCATVKRMSETERERLRETLRAATRKYQRTEKAHEEARKEVTAAIVDALRGGVRPAEVETDGPFKGPYIRRIRDEHGIPAFKKGQPAPPPTE
ncbi:hypothetical protein ACQPYK_49700 (plasmid) [Streptosporangium sp. CA-135522]|uniref:hypothetical protein n=1 Tax=Streptosporangium sp. CA-135522 TaxID=3240072 RepID=UPI003D8E12D3